MEFCIRDPWFRPSDPPISAISVLDMTLFADLASDPDVPLRSRLDETRARCGLHCTTGAAVHTSAFPRYTGLVGRETTRTNTVMFTSTCVTTSTGSSGVGACACVHMEHVVHLRSTEAPLRMLGSNLAALGTW